MDIIYYNMYMYIYIYVYNQYYNDIIYSHKILYFIEIPEKNMVRAVRPPTKTRYRITRTAVGLNFNPAPKPGTKLKASALRYTLNILKYFSTLNLQWIKWDTIFMYILSEGFLK